MARCEDFPCCGHELGCCPSFDEDGNQIDMVCTCGARLPVTNRYSICDSCMRGGDEDEYYDIDEEDYDDDEEDYDDDAHERWVETQNEMRYDRYFYEE